MKKFTLIALFVFSCCAGNGQTKRTVTIAGYAFIPAILTVFPGDTLEWMNMDILAHTATSDSSVWDTGNLAPNATGSYIFKKIGMYPYHCAIHTFMVGQIIVTDIAPVDESMAFPPKFILSTIYPNPLRDRGSITVSLGIQSYITITLLNTLGHNLGNIVEGTFPEGRNSFPVFFHGLPAGEYFYKMKAFDRRGKLLCEKSRPFVIAH